VAARARHPEKLQSLLDGLGVPLDGIGGLRLLGGEYAGREHNDGCHGPGQLTHGFLSLNEELKTKN
jgi:hypothetical protein